MQNNPDSNKYFITQLNSLQELLDRAKKSNEATTQSSKRLDMLQ
jgi:hypothetical protein